MKSRAADNTALTTPRVGHEDVNWQLEVGRLDGAFGFLPTPEGLEHIPVVAVPDACHLGEPLALCMHAWLPCQGLRPVPVNSDVPMWVKQGW